MRRGQYDAAAKIYERLIALNPSDFNARLGRCFGYFKMSDYARCFKTKCSSPNRPTRGLTRWPELR